MIPQTKVINDGQNVGLAKTIAQTSKEYQSLRAAMVSPMAPCKQTTLSLRLDSVH